MSALVSITHNSFLVSITQNYFADMFLTGLYIFIITNHWDRNNKNMTSQKEKRVVKIIT